MCRFTLVATVILIATAGCGAYTTSPGGYHPADSTPAGLWTAGATPPAVLRLAPDRWNETGSFDPSTAITTPSAGLGATVGLAFAPDGALWVTSPNDDRLLAFAQSALKGSGPATATVVLESAGPSLLGATGLAFDSAHHLWVASYEGGSLVRFDPAQLTASGTPVPAVVISGVGRPTALAFDAAGAVWVSDFLADRVVRYDPDQLAASGSPEPAAQLKANAGSLKDPTGLAFDAAGNLWVANLVGRTVVAFGPDQLVAGGSVAPRVILASDNGAFNAAVGLAFDATGGLWVVQSSGTLTRYAATSLRASGAPAPAARVAIAGQSAFWGAAIWPRPSGLPLH